MTGANEMLENRVVSRATTVRVWNHLEEITNENEVEYMGVVVESGTLSIDSSLHERYLILKAQ